MIDTATIIPMLPIIYGLIILIAIWDGVWKGISLWHAAKNNHLSWFICLIIFNTMGILPIIYLTCFQKKAKDKSY